jgi:hypothetical protein
VSSPTGVGARNSSDAEPPIAPECAATGRTSMPSRAKIRRYASRTAAYDRASDSSSRSKE